MASFDCQKCGMICCGSGYPEASQYCEECTSKMTIDTLRADIERLTRDNERLTGILRLAMAETAGGDLNVTYTGNLQLYIRTVIWNLKDRIAELERDRERMDWLIKQGPPGAAEGIGLNDEAWEIAMGFVDDEKDNADNRCIRAAIDSARAALEGQG